MNEEIESFSNAIYRKNIVELKQRYFSLSSLHSRYLKVIVIGGSLGGLFTAIALRHINCDVEVFETSSVEMKDHGAGIVLQMETVNFLKEHKIIPKDGTAVSIPVFKRQYLRKDDTIESEVPTLQLMTSWELLYRLLKGAFPEKLYYNKRRMTSIEQKKDEVIVYFKGDQKDKTCHLLVGADGAGSTIRHQLLPQILPSYAGYVVWRGLVNENKVNSKVLDTFSNKFTFFIGKKTHILCYLIPGPNGELSEGMGWLNWIWYANTSLKNGTLKKVMADKNGVVRALSVPAGMVNEDIVKEQKIIAHDTLPNSFQHLVFATKEPFIQAIYDQSVPKMAFDRICLIGDTSFVVRLHTAAGTSKAAKNAVALAKSLQQYRGDVNTALKMWEPSQLALDNYLLSLGIRLGSSSQM
jgi:2,6-dihydroxypyridine 3-monooxygenase